MYLFNLIKQLGVGFLPVFIFIFADLFFKETISLLIAVVFGLLELLYYYLKEKKFDGFILLDILFLLILGGLSLLLNNLFFFKLKPAVIELLFVVLLGFSAFSSFNILELMSQRYFKNLKFDSSQKIALRRISAVLFFVFLMHTLLIVVAAVFWSHRVWAFVSGGLFYIIFILIFVIQLLKKRAERFFWKRKYAAEEWLDVVNASGKVLFAAPRSLCHQRPELLHRVIHVQIINEQNQIFLQKRKPDREIQPDRWDTAVGGHVRSGESVEEALKRELFEETGLTGFKLIPFASYIWKSERESELVYLFLMKTRQIPVVNKDEASEGKFFKIKKLRQMLGQGLLTPNFEYEFKLLLEKYFKEETD